MNNYVNKQWGKPTSSKSIREDEIGGTPISDRMQHNSHARPQGTGTIPMEGVSGPRTGSTRGAHRPEVCVHGALKCNDCSQIGNRLPTHHAGQAPYVDSGKTCHTTEALTRLEHCLIAGLDEQRNSDGVVGSTRPKRAVGPVSPINQPGIGRGVAAGHGTHSAVYPSSTSGVEGIVMITEVLHMCITSLKHEHYEAHSDNERDSDAYPMRCMS